MKERITTLSEHTVRAAVAKNARLLLYIDDTMAETCQIVEMSVEEAEMIIAQLRNKITLLKERRARQTAQRHSAIDLQ